MSNDDSGSLANSNNDDIITIHKPGNEKIIENKYTKEEIKEKRIIACNSNRVDKENLFDYKILIKIPYDYIIELLRSIKFILIEDVYVLFFLNINELKYKEESNFTLTM